MIIGLLSTSGPIGTVQPQEQHTWFSLQQDIQKGIITHIAAEPLNSVEYYPTQTVSFVTNAVFEPNELLQIATYDQTDSFPRRIHLANATEEGILNIVEMAGSFGPNFILLQRKSGQLVAIIYLVQEACEIEPESIPVLPSKKMIVEVTDKEGVVTYTSKTQLKFYPEDSGIQLEPQINLDSLFSYQKLQVPVIQTGHEITNTQPITTFVINQHESGPIWYCVSTNTVYPWVLVQNTFLPIAINEANRYPGSAILPPNNYIESYEMYEPLITN